MTKRNLSDTNRQKLKSELSQQDLDQTVRNSLIDEPNISYNLFIEKIVKTHDQHMPLTKKKFNRKVDKINDWITPALLKSITNLGISNSILHQVKPKSAFNTFATHLDDIIGSGDISHPILHQILLLMIPAEHLKSPHNFFVCLKDLQLAL